MFLRRFIKSDVSLGGTKQDSKTSNQGPPHGMQTMGASLQSKFSRGVHYNMKIIIKGDRNVGKTCLHLRLQGQKFREEYLPTDEIQVASIQWSYKTSDDIIKVEVWDIVDKGRKKKKTDGLKLNTSLSQLSEETCLDAEFVDVYKGTQGVIMVFDVTKQWTFDYVEKEIPKVPSSVPILVLANHRDMGHHRTVTEEQVRTLVDELQQSRDGPIKYAESSMRNGYGLKYIHKFFSLPFLHLQRTTLMIQLEKNSEDIEATMQELDLLESTEDQNYDIFSDAINTKRREQQEKLAQKAIEEARIQQQEQQMQQQMSSQTARSNGGVTSSMTKSFSFSTNLPPIKEAHAAQPPSSLKLLQNSTIKSQSASLDRNSVECEIIPSRSVPSTPCQGQTASESSTGGGFLGKFLSSGKKLKKQDKNGSADNSVIVSSSGVSKDYTNQASLPPPVKDVDEFRPDVEGIYDNFLDDVTDEVVTDSKHRSKTSQKDGGLYNQHEDSDEDTPCSNPLVAGYQDHLDSSDEETYREYSAAEPKNMNYRKVNTGSNAKLDLSSSDDDDDIPEVTTVTRSKSSKSKEVIVGSQLKSREEPNNKDNEVPTSTAEGGTSRSSPVLHTLNAADFDALEEKYIKQVPKNTSFCAEGPGAHARADDDGADKKKKKPKNKNSENSDDEKNTLRKPSKKKSDGTGQTKKSKHRTKDYGDAPDESSSSSGAKKKKSRNKKNQDDDLENFLRSAPSTYESL